MPAYTTISCSFNRRDHIGLVREFYDVFFNDGVAFNSVFAWGCNADMTLEQIVEWNQTKLDADFTLGYDQHVKHNYRQIMLAVAPFSKCRLILSNRDSVIVFRCIVPESEINTGNCDSLERACHRVWSQLPVQAVESYDELGMGVGPLAIRSGESPSAQLFAFIDIDCEQHEYIHRYNAKQLDRGYLLTPNDA